MINDIMSIHVSFIIFMLNHTNRAHYCCTLSEAHHFLTEEIFNITSLYCSLQLYGNHFLLLLHCIFSSQSVCHQTSSEICWRKRKKEKALIFLSSSTGTTQVEGLESNLASSSPATVQFLHSHFEQGTVGNILLSPQECQHLSLPRHRHTGLSSAATSNCQVDQQSQKALQIQLRFTPCGNMWAVSRALCKYPTVTVFSCADNSSHIAII